MKILLQQSSVFTTHTNKPFLSLYGITFTSDGYRQGLAFSGDKDASTELDPIQAVVIALIGGLGIRKGECDRRREGRQRVAHSAIGADQTQLEGTSRVLLQSGAGDVKTVAFNDRAGRGLGGCVVPVLRSQKFHCDQQNKGNRLS